MQGNLFVKYPYVKMNWWADLTYFWQVECNQIRDEHKLIISTGQAILKGFFSHFTQKQILQ